MRDKLWRSANSSSAPTMTDGFGRPAARPRQEQVVAMALSLGMDPYAHEHLLYIAEGALTEPLPGSWVRIVEPEGSMHFIDTATGRQSDLHPNAAAFQRQYQERLATAPSAGPGPPPPQLLRRPSSRGGGRGGLDENNFNVRQQLQQQHRAGGMPPPTSSSPVSASANNGSNPYPFPANWGRGAAAPPQQQQPPTRVPSIYPDALYGGRESQESSLGGGYGGYGADSSASQPRAARVNPSPAVRESNTGESEALREALRRERARIRELVQQVRSLEEANRLARKGAEQRVQNAETERLALEEAVEDERMNWELQVSRALVESEEKVQTTLEREREEMRRDLQQAVSFERAQAMEEAKRTLAEGRFELAEKTSKLEQEYKEKEAILASDLRAERERATELVSLVQNVTSQFCNKAENKDDQYKLMEKACAAREEAWRRRYEEEVVLVEDRIAKVKEELASTHRSAMIAAGQRHEEQSRAAVRAVEQRHSAAAQRAAQLIIANAEAERTKLMAKLEEARNEAASEQKRRLSAESSLAEASAEASQAHTHRTAAQEAASALRHANAMREAAEAAKNAESKRASAFAVRMKAEAEAAAESSRIEADRAAREATEAATRRFEAAAEEAAAMSREEKERALAAASAEREAVLAQVARHRDELLTQAAEALEIAMAGAEAEAKAAAHAAELRCAAAVEEAERKHAAAAAAAAESAAKAAEAAAIKMAEEAARKAEAKAVRAAEARAAEAAAEREDALIREAEEDAVRRRRTGAARTHRETDAGNAAHATTSRDAGTDSIQDDIRTEKPNANAAPMRPVVDTLTNSSQTSAADFPNDMPTASCQTDFPTAQDVRASVASFADRATRVCHAARETASAARSQLAANHAELIAQHEAARAAMMQVAMATKEAGRRVEEAIAERRMLNNKLLELKGNIRVFCRIRPLTGPEESEMHALAAPGTTAVPGCASTGSFDCMVHQNGNPDPVRFEMDRVFGSDTTQSDVFEECEPLLHSCLDGYNVCIFAYGQTGSGKTHTMDGPEEDRGITLRAFSLLFGAAEKQWSGFKYEFSCSMVEIYNDTLRDLLHEGSAPPPKLEIRQNPKGGAPFVTNLREVSVVAIVDALRVLRRGAMHRKTGKTDMNQHSSRSHLIVRVNVKRTNIMDGTEAISKLSLIDLAGSERLSRTNATGDRLAEAQHINKSLSMLGTCMAALAGGGPSNGGKSKSHVPYRDCKLTHMLADSLGGNSKTLMFVHASPSNASAHETKCSLQFAERVRSVELRSSAAGEGGGGGAKSKMGAAARVARMEKELNAARAELRGRKAQIEQLQTDVRSMERSHLALGATAGGKSLVRGM